MEKNQLHLQLQNISEELEREIQKGKVNMELI
jgi:hypothetical protein